MVGIGAFVLCWWRYETGQNLVNTMSVPQKTKKLKNAISTRSGNLTSENSPWEEEQAGPQEAPGRHVDRSILVIAQGRSRPPTYRQRLGEGHWGTPATVELSLQREGALTLTCDAQAHSPKGSKSAAGGWGLNCLTQLTLEVEGAMEVFA